MKQEDLSFAAWVGLRFVRELEQGKPTLRMDKVNQVLKPFWIWTRTCRSQEMRKAREAKWWKKANQVCCLKTRKRRRSRNICSMGI